MPSIFFSLIYNWESNNFSLANIIYNKMNSMEGNQGTQLLSFLVFATICVKLGKLFLSILRFHFLGGKCYFEEFADLLKANYQLWSSYRTMGLKLTRPGINSILIIIMFCWLLKSPSTVAEAKKTVFLLFSHITRFVKVSNSGFNVTAWWHHRCH